MINAHLRFAKVSFQQKRKESSTNISALVNLFVGEATSGHIISMVGSDSVMAAMSAAILSGLSLTITAPGSQSVPFSMGEKPLLSRSCISVPGRKQPLRHVVALSEALWGNKPESGVFVLNNDDALAFPLVANRLGLPARPEWAKCMMKRLRDEERITQLTGFNCDPVKILAERSEVIEWIGEGVKKRALAFPAENGPILWPSYNLAEILRTGLSEEEVRLRRAA